MVIGSEKLGGEIVGVAYYNAASCLKIAQHALEQQATWGKENADADQSHASPSKPMSHWTATNTEAAGYPPLILVLGRVLPDGRCYSPVTVKQFAGHRVAVSTLPDTALPWQYLQARKQRILLAAHRKTQPYLEAAASSASTAV